MITFSTNDVERLKLKRQVCGLFGNWFLDLFFMYVSWFLDVLKIKYVNNLFKKILTHESFLHVA